MTNSTIDGTKILLIDLWPGTPDANRETPIDGFTGADHHNVAAAKFPVGTKIKVYDTTGLGYATFIYLQYRADATKVALASGALAAKQFVAPLILAQTSQATTSTWYKVGDAGDTSMVFATNSTQGGPIAVALSAMTDTYYGWFWCGGVQPTALVPALTGNYVTDGSLVAGGKFVGKANASATGTVGKKIVLTNVAQSAATSLTIATACGFSLIADA